MLICGTSIIWPEQFKPWKVHAVGGHIMVVSVLTHYAFLQSMCDSKSVQINMQCILIWELRLYELKLSHNTIESTKNICHVKTENAVDHNTITWRLKKFCSGCKSLNGQVRSYIPKTTDSETMLQDSVVCHLYNLGKNFWSSQIVSHVPKYCKTFDWP